MLSDCRVAWLAGILVALWRTAAVSAEPEAGTLEFFEAHIRPVLVEHCQGCHGAASKPPRGGLRVERRADLLRGAGWGPPWFLGSRPRAGCIWR